MKMKKLLALMLAAVLALTMLTACGGGKGKDVDISDVNAILQSQGLDIEVKSSMELNTVMNIFKAAMRQNDIYLVDTEILASELGPLMPGFACWQVYSSSQQYDTSLEHAAANAVRDLVAGYGANYRFYVSGIELVEPSTQIRYWFVIVGAKNP